MFVLCLNMHQISITQCTLKLLLVQWTQYVNIVRHWNFVMKHSASVMHQEKLYCHLLPLHQNLCNHLLLTIWKIENYFCARYVNSILVFKCLITFEFTITYRTNAILNLISKYKARCTRKLGHCCLMATRSFFKFNSNPKSFSIISC